MPLTEAQPDAVANVYARALLDLAHSQGGQVAVESTLGELDDILDLARADTRFGEFFASRILAKADRDRALRTILDGRASQTVINFLLVLNRKGRLGHITGITAAYDKLVQSAFGRVEVDVYTAQPAEPDEQASLRERLRGILGKEPVLHFYTEPGMIGGIKLQIADQLVDASIATRLRKLREQMNTQGSAIIKGSAERLITADAPHAADTGH